MGIVRPLNHDNKRSCAGLDEDWLTRANVLVWVSNLTAGDHGMKETTFREKMRPERVSSRE